MVKYIYLDSKINLLQCHGAELHPEVALDHVDGIVVGVGVHGAVIKPVPIKSACSKTYIWTPRSTFYNVWELSYTLKWPWAMLLVYQTSAASPTLYQALTKYLIDEFPLRTNRPHLIIIKIYQFAHFVN